MPDLDTTKVNILDPKVEIADEVLFDDEAQVIVHCSFTSITGHDGIRIWPSTYLFDQHSDHVSSLVHIEGISLYPYWTWVRKGTTRFTLIFKGLPKHCRVFDLLEDCNGAPGSFRIIGIKRTTDDVYYVHI